MQFLQVQTVTHEKLLSELTEIRKARASGSPDRSTDTSVSQTTAINTKKKMPAPSDKESQIWYGKAETLEECLSWFESTAKDRGVDDSEMKTSWFKYVAAAQVEVIKSILHGLDAWSAVKERLRDLYPDRSKQVEGTLESLQEFAEIWSKKPLQRIEHLTARVEAYARNALKFEADEGSDNSINKFWFMGMPLDWQKRYREEVWHKNVKKDRTRFPDRKVVEQWVRVILDPTDVIENHIIESMYPSIRTHQELAQEADDKKRQYLGKLQRGKAEVIQLRTADDEYKEEPIKLETEQIDDVDELVRKMGELTIKSQSVRGITPSERAKYIDCHARLAAVRPILAEACPSNLPSPFYRSYSYRQNPPVAHFQTVTPLGDLLEQMELMKERNRTGYREDPEYKELYAKVNSMSVAAASLLQTPLIETTSVGHSRDTPPHAEISSRPGVSVKVSSTNQRAAWGEVKPKCHWCRDSNHFVRDCPNTAKWAKDGWIKQVDGFWVWALNNARIKRHADGTYESTVRDYVRTAEHNAAVNSALSAALMARDFEQSMYPEEDEI